MPIIHIQNGCFDLRANLLATSQKQVPMPDGRLVDYDPYKLHFVFPGNLCYRVSKAINALLDEAAENFVIRAYKVINYARLTKFSKREEYVPYTIYLNEEYTATNADDVLLYCNKITTLLAVSNIPTVKSKQFVYPSECPLGPYILFRATNTQKNMAAQIYKYILGTDWKEAVALKETGLQSDYYKHFQKALLAAEEKVESAVFLTSAAVTLSQHVAQGKSPVCAPVSDGEETEKKSNNLTIQIKKVV